MTYNPVSLKLKIAAISDREFLLYQAGLAERFHLGESGCPGLHLVDATAQEVLNWIEGHK